MELEIINKLYLELSQVATAKTAKEIRLMKEVDAQAKKHSREIMTWASELSTSQGWDGDQYYYFLRGEDLQSGTSGWGIDEYAAAVNFIDEMVMRDKERLKNENRGV